MAQRDLNAGNRWTAARISGAFPAGIIGYANRTSNKSFTTVTGYLRLDSIPLVSGRAYLVMAQNIRVSISVAAGATDHLKFAITHDLTGATAGTGSTELGRAEASFPSYGTTFNDTIPAVLGWVFPTSDVTASFLLTATRVAGSGTYAVQADTPGINLIVSDMGLAVADTGTDI
jgi:hypothetical protein